MTHVLPQSSAAAANRSPGDAVPSYDTGPLSSIPRYLLAALQANRKSMFVTGVSSGLAPSGQVQQFEAVAARCKKFTGGRNSGSLSRSWTSK